MNVTRKGFLKSSIAAPLLALFGIESLMKDAELSGENYSANRRLAGDSDAKDILAYSMPPGRVEVLEEGKRALKKISIPVSIPGKFSARFTPPEAQLMNSSYPKFEYFELTLPQGLHPETEAELILELVKEFKRVLKFESAKARGERV